ncbi:SGNH hydrolase [Byssothecium circinans]|uniref:SGNH hydrolase n=1 Tax=Byssothecium circinans TaxID=147558 RepID=A0A6A5U6I0_9PLEO|nr:SGNH hydrolase [Byssothecium circinans]
MRYSLATFSLNLAFAVGQYGNHSNGWELKNFKTLVTFGDSFTDENRLGYFGSHNGSAPPVGWDQPVGTTTSTGGLVWPRYASYYTNTTLYNYAVSGATCSNALTPRTTINAPFPDIQGYEIPAFLADSQYTRPNGSAFFTGTPSDTVYAIWIGTNDLGNNAFLTDSQVAGKTLKDYVDCIYSAIATLYANGARYFVLMNLAPLQLLPQYATPANGGLAATKFFPDKGPNITEISWRMYESVVTVNEIFAYRTPYLTSVAKTYPGIKIANFDVNALITDIWTRPEAYLNGTAPFNVTGVVKSCDSQGRNCVVADSPDSYVWYDELHPSEQTDRVVAREFVGVLGGRSRWAAYWG